VRGAAAIVVARVLNDGCAADDALATAPPLDARDAPLLAALVLGALSWHHRLAWQTDRLLTRPLKPRQTELGALLRIGLLQLQHFRIPDHAAVSATVDAAALLGERGAAGLVNAVLRRFQREREQLDGEMHAALEARFSHPQWIVEWVRRDWPGAWQAILDANNVAAPMWLRVNRQRMTRAAYLDKLRDAGIAARAAPDVDDAVLLEVPQAVETLPGFLAGEVSVQDVAAQRAVAWLDLQPGQRILDACAAPGGKTGHILEVCEAPAEVWAVDRDAQRLSKVGDNLRRLGLTAKLIAGDATRPAQWWDGQPFDRILLDAPCSALGVIRRHPDIKLRRRPADVERAVALQAELLRGLWPLLKAGGRLVYATCTVLKCENDEQIAAFLRATPAAELVRSRGTTLGQSLPGEADGDGFYYAAVLKPQALRTASVSPPQQ
jgi:16S rRNA (cytosine967-C5)-methyltransferase